MRVRRTGSMFSLTSELLRRAVKISRFWLNNTAVIHKAEARGQKKQTRYKRCREIIQQQQPSDRYVDK